MLRRAVVRAAAALVATTTTAAATTAVAEPASPPYRRAKPPRDSPFSYRELDEAVARAGTKSGLSRRTSTRWRR